ncbi:hypothetical protein [Actinoallomurus acaciae]|uniref:Uncharacterized protein n=1 Tax=Actinoallomurus acaciae TaxID=502577 RepID=A0ABV5YDV4_9ACTN
MLLPTTLTSAFTPPAERGGEEPTARDAYATRVRALVDGLLS